MTDGSSSASHGPLAEEAARLFAAVQTWLGEHTGGFSDAAGGLSEKIAAGGTECKLCPFCQLIGLVRAAQPEVVEHLADASASLVAALSAAIAAHEKHWAGQRRGRTPDVERIDIS